MIMADAEDVPETFCATQRLIEMQVQVPATQQQVSEFARPRNPCTVDGPQKLLGDFRLPNC